MILETGTLFLALLLAGAGLLAGSFLGLVSLRLPAGGRIVSGRSRCDGCGRPVAPWRLIPLFSYLLSRGRCGLCGASIPIRYPLMEAACALIGVGSAVTQPSLIGAALTALLGWQLLLIAVVDGEHFWLPDALTLPLLATGLTAAAVLEDLSLVDSVAGAAAGFVALWLLGRLYKLARGREGLGGGDPVLLAAGGAWVGWIGLPSVLLWAAVSGLSLVAARALTGHAVSGADRIPFGVFLAIGIGLTWLLGPLGLSR